MQFFQQIKPKNNAERAVVVLVVLLAIATAILALTRQLVPSEENKKVKLQAINSEETTPRESVKGTTAKPSSEVSTTIATKEPQKNDALLSLKHYSDAMSELNTKQLNPLMKTMRKQYKDEVKESVRRTTQPETETQTEPVYYEPVYTDPPTEEWLEEPTEVITETLEVTSTESETFQITQTTPFEFGYVDPRTKITYEWAPTGTLDPNEFAGSGQGSLPYNEPAPTEAMPAEPDAAGLSGDPNAQVNVNPMGVANNEPPQENQAASYGTVDPALAGQMAGEVLSMINGLRQSAGLTPLANDPTIQAIANQRAAELSVLYDAAHTRPDGSFSIYWIWETYGERYGQGENIGWFEGAKRYNSQHIYTSFRDSPSHYEIMMNPAHTIGAVSIYCVGEKFYVCMNFGY